MDTSPSGPPRATTGPPEGSRKCSHDGAISLAGVLDLMRAGAAAGSTVPVSAFMGAPRPRYPSDYALADPARLVPASCPVWAVHADRDGTVPPEQSRRTSPSPAQPAATVKRVVVPGDHFAVIDPTASCFPAIRDLVVEASS